MHVLIHWRLFPHRSNNDLSLAATSAATARMLRAPAAPVRPLKRLQDSGFALVEAVIGMTLISLLLGCVFAVDSQILRLLKSGKESNHATQIIQERIEQMRTSLWDQATDIEGIERRLKGEGLNGTIKKTATSVNFPDATETIKVEPLVDPKGSIACVRSASGTVNRIVVGTLTNFTDEQSVKMTISVQWTSHRRIRKREVVTVLTKGGI